MKKLLLFLLVAGFQLGTQAQDFIRELEGSMAKNEAGAGDAVEYIIYLSATNVKTFYAKDFDKGVVVKSNGEPTYFELINMAGENSESVMINLKTVAYMEVELVNLKGKNKYKYRFYY